MIRNLREKLGALESDRPADVPKASSILQGEAACRCFTERLPLDEPVRSGALVRLPKIEPGILSAVFRARIPEDFSWDQVVFLDTETTGLSGGTGTVAFLAGLGWLSGGCLEIEQYFMQDYDRETDMLDRLCSRLGTAGYLVTFNGKCFDAPILSSRLILNRIRPPIERLVHLDLLHPSRRMYRRRLESCPLSRLESEVLGVVREGDIPGSLIPEVFFSYLRDGDITLMEKVIGHNRQDVLTMCLLTVALCDAYRNPESLSDPRDVYSCGRILEANRDERASACYLRAAEALAESRAALAGWHKQRGEWERAVPLWEQMAERGEGGCRAYIELAKYYEHRAGDWKAALQWSEKALARLRAPGIHDIMREETRALLVRIERLRRRML